MGNEAEMSIIKKKKNSGRLPLPTGEGGEGGRRREEGVGAPRLCKPMLYELAGSDNTEGALLRGEARSVFSSTKSRVACLKRL